MEEKWWFWYPKWHQWRYNFGTVNGLNMKCESWYQYSRVLDIILKLWESALFDTVIVRYKILYFHWRRTIATFQSVFYAVTHSWSPGNIKEEQTLHCQVSN